jgi:hypothetical protein
MAGAVLLAQTASADAADGLVKASLKAPATLAEPVADAKGHFAKAAFGQSASPGTSGDPVAATAAADSGVVVTYANNRSSVVITGNRFGPDSAVTGRGSDEHRP